MENVLADSKRTPTQKNILLRLALYQNMTTGRLDPSIAGLAAGTATRDRTVQLALSRAERDGLIERDIGGGRDRSSYRLLLNAGAISSVESESVSKPVQGGKPAIGETPVHKETPVHTKTGTGARACTEGCTVVHPNSENRKKNRKEGSRSGFHLSDPFEEWWLLYPKRVSKGAAQKAYAKVMKANLATVEELKAGVMRYARERAGLDSQFTKHPATWLNQECWKDEPPKPGGVIGAGDFNGGGVNGA